MIAFDSNIQRVHSWAQRSRRRGLLGIRAGRALRPAEAADSAVVHRTMWEHAAKPGFSRRRIYDARRGLCLVAQGVREFATVNLKDFRLRLLDARRRQDASSDLHEAHSRAGHDLAG